MNIDVKRLKTMSPAEFEQFKDELIKRLHGKHPQDVVQALASLHKSGWLDVLSTVSNALASTKG